jgi:nucleotidyltransferase substrate binding protein (TIGR01987 family)
MPLPEKRWIQRLDNYSTVLRHLEDFAAMREERSLTLAEEFAILKAFELTFECAWNMMKDFLEDKGVEGMHGPRDVLRHAFRAGLMKNGLLWFEMLKARNRTAHAYDEEAATDVSFTVSSEYVEEFVEIRATFEQYKEEWI